jgi:hypothetical protein
MRAPSHAIPKMRRQEGRTAAASVPIQGGEFKMTDSKSPRPVAGAGFHISCDDEDMPVICPTCQIPSQRSNFAPHKAAS